MPCGRFKPTRLLCPVRRFAVGLLFAVALHGAIVADYASAIAEVQPRSDGLRHLNTPATLAAIQSIHANTYFFLVHSQFEWDDMRNEFLPAAAKAGLDVWLYFVPPTECPEPCSLPFGADYVRIAEGTAKLSVQYPNLKGMAIDDFADNLKLYTPEYIVRLRNAGRAVNPAFQFLPLLYWRSMLPEFLDRYAAGIDGVIMAYRDEPTINTTRNGSLRAQLDRAEALTGQRGKSLILMMYCAPLGRIPIPPSVAYVRDSLAMGLADVASRKLAGVVTYKLSKTGEPAPATENYAHSGRGRATILESGPGLPAGSFGELTSRVSVTGAAAKLRLWHSGTYAKLPPGYFFLQILVDDRTVWDQDLAETASGTWKEETIDFGDAFVKSREATLRVRLTNKRSTGSISVILGVDDLAAEGFNLTDPGLEDPAKWTPTQTNPAFLPMVQVFDPDRLRKMQDAVKELYLRASSTPLVVM